MENSDRGIEIFHYRRPKFVSQQTKRGQKKQKQSESLRDWFKKQFKAVCFELRGEATKQADVSFGDK